MSRFRRNDQREEPLGRANGFSTPVVLMPDAQQPVAARRRRAGIRGAGWAVAVGGVAAAIFAYQQGNIDLPKVAAALRTAAAPPQPAPAARSVASPTTTAPTPVKPTVPAPTLDARSSTPAVGDTPDSGDAADLGAPLTDADEMQLARAAAAAEEDGDALTREASTQKSSTRRTGVRRAAEEGDRRSVRERAAAATEELDRRLLHERARRATAELDAPSPRK